MTDGEQTIEKGSKKTVNEILAEASQPLKDKKVHIISLGIGKRVNRSSLKTIATENNVYYAKTFSALRQLVRQLRKGSCTGERIEIRFIHNKCIKTPELYNRYTPCTVLSCCK